MVPSRSGILAEAINTMMNLISIEQEDEEGNTLRTDPSNSQGNFNSQITNSFVFTSLTHLDAK